MINQNFDILDFNVSLDECFQLGFRYHGLPVNGLPERLNESLICFCVSGTAEIEADFIRYQLGPQVVFIAFPYQVIELKKFSSDFLIHYISCSRDLLNNILLRFPPDFILFLQKNPVFKTSDEVFQLDMDFLNRLKLKYEDRTNICRSSIIIHMIRIHYLEMFNSIQSFLKTDMGRHSRKAEIMKEFVQLLLKNHLSRREVQYYASCLNITPKYLSMITMELNGSSAKKYIDNFLITEIKLELKSSTDSIQEIAETFNFPDPSFFTKYFKRHTGQSPKEFRLS